MVTERVYFSYLLRLWQREDSGTTVWLASLEEPLTGERRGFSDLEALFDFLRAQTSKTTLNLDELKGEQNGSSK